MLSVAIDITSLLCNTLAVIFHIIGLKRKENRKQWQNLARGFTITAIILLGTSYLIIMYDIQAFASTLKLHSKINAIHAFLIMLPIAFIEIYFSQGL